MRNIILGVIIGLAVGVAGAWLLFRHPAEKEGEKKEEKKEEARVQHGTNGETFLKIDKETQERCGLKVAAAEAAETSPQLRAFGRVLDPSLLATQLVDVNSAKATLDASRKEYERVKTLHGQGQNVSTRSVELAEAAVKRDDILVQAAQAKLRLTWGKSIAERKDLPEFLDSLVSLRSALARIDVPMGQAVTNLPSGARIAPVNAPQNFAEGKFLGLATSADPQVQGQGFLFLTETNSFFPGTAVVGYLAFPGTPKKGVLVPSSALVRYEGQLFVFVQKGDDKFEREEVKLDLPLKDGWLVAGEVSAGDKLVVTGAQQLLSEELKSRTAEE